MQHLDSNAKVEQFLQEVDNFLLDCDGVLWNGSTLIENVKETIHVLRQMGKKLFFLTNNSTKSRKQYVQKFKKLGIDGVSEEEIINSGYATALYLKERAFDKKVYLIGCEGLYHEMLEVGIKCFTDENGNPFPHNNLPYSEEEFAKKIVDPDIGAVVIGYDNQFNNSKLAYAHLCLQRKECEFIATNTDASLPFGMIKLPGAGSFVSCLQTCSGRKATVIGKPHTLMLDVIINERKLNRNRSVMVGDRLDTDIMMGNRGKVKTCSVLTGITKEQDLKNLSNSNQSDNHETVPTYVLKSFGDLCTLISSKK